MGKIATFGGMTSLRGMRFVGILASLFMYLAVAGQTPLRMGLRFGYGLELPSKNLVGGQIYYVTEAGHRLNYGAFLDIGDVGKVTFSPYVGLEHQSWPKSEAYGADCTQDSFPTFWAVDDSLPGRDHRMINLVLEPAIRVKLRFPGTYLRFVPTFALTIQSKVEDYTHTCGAPLIRNWLDYSRGDLRSSSPLQFGMGLGFVKEVKINERSGFMIEPGVRGMLSSLFKVRSVLPEHPAFNLQPWGFYVNIGFFR